MDATLLETSDKFVCFLSCITIMINFFFTTTIVCALSLEFLRKNKQTTNYNHDSHKNTLMTNVWLVHCCCYFCNILYLVLQSSMPLGHNPHDYSLTMDGSQMKCKTRERKELCATSVWNMCGSVSVYTYVSVGANKETIIFKDDD